MSHAGHYPYVEEPFYQDDWLTIHAGDCREVMAAMEPESIQCVVTSPPYFGLRDYGIEPSVWGGEAHEHEWGTAGKRRNGRDWDPTLGPSPVERDTSGSTGQFCPCGAWLGVLGLEPTVEAYVAHMVEVFRGVRRVLRKDGCAWLNLGDSYASGGSGPSQSRQRQHDRPCDTDGTARSGSLDLGSACLGLCDECLADYQIHLRRSVHSDRPGALWLPRPEPTDRGSETPGSALEVAGSMPPDAQESTSLGSWLRLRGACLRCDSRAASLSGIDSDAPGSLPSAGRSQSERTRGTAQRSGSLAGRTSDTEPSSTAWEHYTSTLPAKSRMMVPARVALALQADGWLLRDEIVWHKPNPMPSSVTDRTTPAHEMVYLLTRSARYSIDMAAISEPATYSGPNGAQLSPYGQGFTRRSAALSFDRATKEADVPGQSVRQHRVGRDAKQAQIAANSCPSTERTMGGFNDRWDASEENGSAPLTRNKRSVWTVATAPYPAAHFATFPPKLVEPMILAGSKPGDVILDPFGGSGTVGMVAQMHSRRAVLIDLNPDYLAQQMQRCAQSPLGLESVS